MPNCKNTEMASRKTNCDPVEIFFVSPFAIFSNGSHLDLSSFFLFSFKTIQESFWIQIWLKSIQRLLRYQFHVLCYFEKQQMEPSWNTKLRKIEIVSCNYHSGRKLDQFQSKILEILSFSCLCYF